MNVPPKVEAADTFVFRVYQLTGGDEEHSRRDLTEPEQATYNAALDVLRNYFTGEQSYEKPVNRKE